MRVLSVFGTRPEAIKMAPVIRELAGDPFFESRVCVTGQHRQMLDQVLDLFALTPDHDLGVMRTDQDLYEVTARILLGLRDVLHAEQPELVLVQGDTTTCLAGALAAFYQRIPVAHVEAGLRTGNLAAPFPEEGNRAMTTRIASLHFAPTGRARQNLLAEGVDSADIHVTGNTVVDALFAVRQQQSAQGEWTGFGSAAPVLESGQPFVLITGHRRENFGPGFERICTAIIELARCFPGIHFVYPVHLNPRVQEPVRLRLGRLDNVHLLAPLEYGPFVRAMDRALLILTDSGGVQEEAPSLGKPVLVMRETTERPEAVEAGTVILVGTDPERIVSEATRLLTDSHHYQAMAARSNPYGDGRAAGRIRRILRAWGDQQRR